MIEISVRELNRNFKRYRDLVKQGKSIVITNHNRPDCMLIDFHASSQSPSWKKPFKPVKARGKSVIEELREERDQV